MVSVAALLFFTRRFPAIIRSDPILAKCYLVVILVDGHLEVTHHEVICVDARTPTAMLFSIILVTRLA